MFPPLLSNIWSQLPLGWPRILSFLDLLCAVTVARPGPAPVARGAPSPLSPHPRKILR